MEIKKSYGRNLLISHIADNDGLGAPILCGLVYLEKQNDVALIEFEELHEFVERLLNYKLGNDYCNYRNYKNIYIVDVSISEKTAKLINKNSVLRKKLLYFDHHKPNYNASKYPFVNMVYLSNGIKPSGTSIFYNYLLNKYPEENILRTTKVMEFVEAVRNYDTFGHKINGNMTGKYLTDLVFAIGRKEFIRKYKNELLNDPNQHLTFSDYDKEYIIDVEMKEKEYVDDCDKNLIRMEINGNNVGVLISDKFRSTVGNDLSERHKDELAYILIVDPKRERFSLRTVNDIDLSLIAKSISPSGGGIKKAAGTTFDIYSKQLLEKIIEQAKKEGKDKDIKSRVYSL